MLSAKRKEANLLRMVWRKKLAKSTSESSLLTKDDSSPAQKIDALTIKRIDLGLVGERKLEDLMIQFDLTKYSFGQI